MAKRCQSLLDESAQNVPAALYARAGRAGTGKGQGFCFVLIF